jgi:hypothetical protein
MFYIKNFYIDFKKYLKNMIENKNLIKRLS